MSDKHPRMTKEILAHADEYAARFENFQPSEQTRISLDEYQRLKADWESRWRATREAESGTS